MEQETLSKVITELPSAELLRWIQRQPIRPTFALIVHELRRRDHLPRSIRF